MDNSRGSNNRRNNTMYYNQMVRDSRVPQGKQKQAHRVKAKSFGSQHVNFSNIMFAPDGWESIFYTVYFFTLPYIVGIIFLFLFIAGATFENFMLLEMSSFFIVWAIGYEVIAALSLTYIAYLYITYLSDDSQKKAQRRHY
ncbi:MAG: hypothetical protein U9Q29_06930 [Campylobacterota bacterium]|nr:hypothetical protein [Campylobacterota bacterium]